MAPSRLRRALRTPPRATRAKPAFSYAEPSSDVELEADEDYASDFDRSLLTNASPPSQSRRPSKAHTRSAIQSPSKKRYRLSNPDSDDEIEYTKPSKKRKSTTPRSSSHAKLSR